MLTPTDDGSPTLLAEEYGVTYHSRFGAVSESMHVFIGAGLRTRALDLDEVHILEAGFGTGLNAFLSALEAEILQRKVVYTGLETNPISLETALGLNYPKVIQVPEKADIYFKMHEASWGEQVDLSANFNFRKLQSPIEEYVEPESYDVIYFDAFAPLAQPELWTADVCYNMYQSLRPGGLLVTYCAQGAYKRNLKAAGFEVERLQGPPGKREMTRAEKVS